MFDVLTTHSKMLEAQIAQQATASSTPPGGLPSKPESNPHEQCNCVALKEGVEDSKGMRLEQGRKVSMAESKKKNDEDEVITFREKGNFEIPKIFPPKLPDPSSFSIPCVVGKVKIDRALCDLGANASLVPYSMFHKLHLEPLQPSSFSLQLADSSETQPLVTFEDVPVRIGDL